MLASTARAELNTLPMVPADCLTQHLKTGAARTLEAKEHVFHEGDNASHVYRVEAGCICVYRLMPNGRRQVTDFAWPGDLIGLGVVQEHTSNAEALTLSRVCSVPMASLYAHARGDAQFSLKLFEQVSHELSEARQMLATLNQRSACEKVAAFLVALSQRNERNGADPHQLLLPMTRTDIADFLGLTIETVSRTLTKFRLKGLIDLAQCAHVTIKNMMGLSELAEGALD